ncbi:MAG: transposase [Candidatus Kaiserbacteria bacterium]|nr:transposase [Candidatus Kaiserbacteria bacterium]
METKKKTITQPKGLHKSNGDEESKTRTITYSVRACTPENETYLRQMTDTVRYRYNQAVEMNMKTQEQRKRCKYKTKDGCRCGKECKHKLKTGRQDSPEITKLFQEEKERGMGAHWHYEFDPHKFSNHIQRAAMNEVTELNKAHLNKLKKKEKSNIAGFRSAKKILQDTITIPHNCFHLYDKKSKKLIALEKRNSTWRPQHNDRFWIGNKNMAPKNPRHLLQLKESGGGKYPEGVPRSAILVFCRVKKRWYCHITFHISDEKKDRKRQLSVLGIDQNAGFHSASNGRHYHYTGKIANHNDRIARESQKYEPKKKAAMQHNNWDSRSRKEQKRLLQLAHKKKSDRVDALNRNFVQDIVAGGYTHVAFEKLSTLNTNKKEKRNLPRYVERENHHKMREMSAYKLKRMLEDRGVEVLEVDPKNTSKACSVCGCVDEKNRIETRRFVCTECGHKQHADINAAHNIRKRAEESIK